MLLCKNSGNRQDHPGSDGAQGKNGAVVVWLTAKGKPVSGDIKGTATLTPDQAQQFASGGWYIKSHFTSPWTQWHAGYLLPTATSRADKLIVLPLSGPQRSGLGNFVFEITRRPPHVTRE